MVCMGSVTPEPPRASLIPKRALATHRALLYTCAWTAVKAHVKDAPVPVWHLGDGALGVRACHQEHKATHSEDLSHTPTEATEPTQLPSCRGVEKAHGGMGEA